MPITFVPDAGEVLMCDFGTGFCPPEMTKVRRVVVLSPRSRTKIKGTYLVVPISKTPPVPEEDYHCHFKPRSYIFFDPVEPVWAKGDMMCCVGFHRLDRLKINGRYTKSAIRKEDLHRIRKSLLHALGMETWAQVEASVQGRTPSPNLGLTPNVA